MRMTTSLGVWAISYRGTKVMKASNWTDFNETTARNFSTLENQQVR